MKKDDLIILIIGLLLLAGMLLTIFFGGEQSRHGIGVILDLPGDRFKICPLKAQPEQKITPENTGLDLCQSRPFSIEV